MFRNAKLVHILELRREYTVQELMVLLNRSQPQVYRMLQNGTAEVEYAGEVGEPSFKAVGIYYQHPI